MDVEKLFIPLLSTDSSAFKENIVVVANFNMNSMNMVPPSHSPISLQNLKGRVQNVTPKKLSIKSEGEIVLENSSELDFALLGPRTQFDASHEFAWGEKNELSIPVSKIELHSDRLYASLEGKINNEGVFNLTEPANVTYTLTPERLELFPFKTSAVALSESAQIDLKATSLDLSLFPFNISSLKLKGEGNAHHLHFKEASRAIEGVIEDISFDFEADSKKNLFTFGIDGKTSIKEANQAVNFGDFSAIGNATQFINENKLDLKNAAVKLDVNLKEFPLFLVEMWKGPQDLLSLLGPSLDLHLNGNYDPKGNPLASFELKAQSDDFFAEMALTLDEQFKLREQKPVVIRWELTPDRYQKLVSYFKPESSAYSDFVLMSRTPVEIYITELMCPATSPAYLSKFLCESGMVANVELGPLNFLNEVTREQFFIQNTKARVHGRDFSKSIAIDASSKFYVNQQTSSIDFTAELLNAWNLESKWDPENLVLRADLNIKDLPVTPFTQILPLKDDTRKDIQALLGPLCNATMSAEISRFNGPVTLVINSSNLQAYLPLELRDNAILLRDTVQANILLTPELGETLLKDVSPLLITAAYSDEPIRLFIDPNNFRIPIRPFSLQNVQVEKAVLDLGKIRVKNGGDVQELMNFLKAKEISRDGEMSAWFTPIFLSLSNGVLTTKRFDALLAQNVHIASWGKIDLLKDKVHMILAIGPTTLRQKFGIFGLNKGDLFQIKMRGSTKKVKLDWTNAYTRIGIIIARTAGGPPGYLIGGLVELIGGSLGEEPTPVPTTSPFPWENGGMSSEGMPMERGHGTVKKGVLKKLFDFIIP